MHYKVALSTTIYKGYLWKVFYKENDAGFKYVILTVKDMNEEKSVPSSYLESLANTFSKMTTN